MAETSVTAESGEEKVAAEVLAANAVPAEETKEPSQEETQPAAVTQADLDKFRNEFRGDFANWTGERAKAVDASVTERVDAELKASREDREAQRTFLISQMDEEQKTSFLEMERNAKIDQMLEKGSAPAPAAEPVVQPAQTQMAPDMQEMATEIQAYAQTNGITLTQEDAWVWQGGTGNDSAFKLGSLARKNIDARKAAPAAEAAPAAPNTKETAPTTASAPKIATTDPTQMTIKESTDAYLDGTIDAEQHRANIER